MKFQEPTSTLIIELINLHATFWHKLGSLLTELFVGFGIGIEEGVLRISKFLGEGFEALVGKQSLISRHFQQLRISRIVRHNSEI